MIHQEHCNFIFLLQIIDSLLLRKVFLIFKVFRGGGVAVDSIICGIETIFRIHPVYSLPLRSGIICVSESTGYYFGIMFQSHTKYSISYPL